MNIPYFKYALGRLLHGLLVSRKPGSWLVRLAFLLLCLMLAGWIILGMQSAAAWMFSALVLAVLMLLAQSNLRQIRSDFREDIEHQVLVIGVGDTSGLLAAIPDHIRGQRISYELPQPLTALKQLLKVEQRVLEALHCQTATGIKVVYAAKAPAPIALLMGFYLGHIRIDAVMEATPFSYDWQLLEGEDDAARFETLGLEHLQKGMRDVTVLMRCGEDGMDQAMSSDLPYPVLTLQLTGAASSLMSASKQICLANQFAALLNALADIGVATVHLHYAGPHSLLFNLGRQYRHSPQPALIIYAEKSDTQESWGLCIPSSAYETAEMMAAGDITTAESFSSAMTPVFEQKTLQQHYRLVS